MLVGKLGQQKHPSNNTQACHTLTKQCIGGKILPLATAICSTQWCVLPFQQRSFLQLLHRHRPPSTHSTLQPTCQNVQLCTFLHNNCQLMVTLWYSHGPSYHNMVESKAGDLPGWNGQAAFLFICRTSWIAFWKFTVNRCAYIVWLLLLSKWIMGDKRYRKRRDQVVASPATSKRTYYDTTVLIRNWDNFNCLYMCRMALYRMLLTAHAPNLAAVRLTTLTLADHWPLSTVFSVSPLPSREQRALRPLAATRCPQPWPTPSC